MDDPYDHCGMNDDAYADDSQEDEQQTQTQSTQQASQPQTVSVDSHLWGFLQPCSSALTRIDFWKINPRYTIGRNTETNQVVLPGFKVSNTHCVIVWDGNEVNSNISVTDLSSNGTFINGEKIGKSQTRILREGNEIAFGTCIPQAHNGGLEDYRFIYRHTASGPPTEGLYAHYDLGIELGKGSFATVHTAMHRVSGKWFAVKMIAGAKTGNRQNNNQSTRNVAIAREISIMEKLEHPNICKLVEVFFQNDNSINLVLELVDGGDLLEHILSHGGLHEDNAKDITYQLCDALAYVHSKGVTHRDLKPENVLLTKQRPPRVKVADFGLAKIVDNETMLRTMCGTPSYLAPEVVKQDNVNGYDNRVDSWSVGVIVFSMLTNSSPFIENENQEIRLRILERKVDWHTLSTSAASYEAQGFIRQLLVPDPRCRMSLTSALDDPWLAQHIPFHLNNDPSSDHDDDNMIPDAEPDARMESSVAEMHAGPGTSTNNGSRPLQRRSLVLSQAAEAGIRLPEPSLEMIDYVSSRDEPSNIASTAVKGPNKRVRADLTPLPEELPDDANMSNPSPNTADVNRRAGDEDSRRRSSRRGKIPRMG